MQEDVITLEGLHEALGNAIGLPASNRGEAGDEVEPGGKRQGLPHGVSATVTGQKLNRSASPVGAKPGLYCQHDDVSNALARKSSPASLPGDDLSVTDVDEEGHPHNLFVPARDYKAFRSPAGVGVQGNDLALMRTAGMLACVLNEQQVVLSHDPLNALVVNQRLTLLGPESVERRSNPSIPRGWPAIQNTSDLRQKFGIGFRDIAPSLFGSALHPLSQVAARHAKGLSYSRYTASSLGNWGRR